MISKNKALKALENVIDPEIGMNIVDIGLIYEIKIDDKKIYVKMTFTSPACPVGPDLLNQVETELNSIGFEKVEIEVTFDPPWTPEKMSEKAKSVMQFM
ncbi:MAG TPA: metal-sulfur cluster assembly factor [Candidatus Bilamarchaeaceae archaeon]|nr:metal-sulfur cluster assembly factor [Candidatus Bilamarchaeaceae archaeon]